MSAWTTAQSVRRCGFVYLAGVTVAAALIAGAWRDVRGADTTQGARVLFRFDPLHHAPNSPYRATLVPVSEQDAKVDCVYSHFSERLDRRVWAIRHANGQFSHALGEGTTQPGPAFDIRGTTEEKENKLEQTDSELLKKLKRQGGFVYFTLDRNNRWQLNPSADHATIYDAETRYRWEWAYGRYVPISSAPFAYRWQVVNGGYVAMKEPWSSETESDRPCWPTGRGSSWARLRQELAE